MRRFIAVLVLSAGCAHSSPSPDGPASGPVSAPAAHGGHAHNAGQGTHDHGRHVDHAFDDPAFWAARFDAPERNEWQKPQTVIELMALELGMAVADIGAGTGYFLPHLSQAVGAAGTVRGLDIEPKMVDYMNVRAKKEGLTNVEAHRIPSDDPKLSPKALDRVLIVNTWHHISERNAYARKIFDGLKVGGALFVVDYEVEAPRGPPKDFKLSAETVAETLRQVGFIVEIMTEDLPHQYVVRGIR